MGRADRFCIVLKMTMTYVEHPQILNVLKMKIGLIQRQNKNTKIEDT